MPTLPVLAATDRVFIAGQWRAGASRETLSLTNPSDGSTLAAIARGNAADIDAAMGAAQAALDGQWGQLSAADDLARLEALDVGKPLKQARNDAVAMARYFEFYGGAADKVMGETIPYARGTLGRGWGGGNELPFGGVKSSGHGREKGFEALYGFSALKTVAIAHGGPAEPFVIRCMT